MTQTFAGFDYPYQFAILPRGPLSARLAEYKQTHGKRTCHMWALLPERSRA